MYVVIAINYDGEGHSAIWNPKYENLESAKEAVREHLEGTIEPYEIESRSVEISEWKDSHSLSTKEIEYPDYGSYCCFQIIQEEE